MKKGSLYLIVAAGVIAIAGIIAVQSYWLYHTFDLKESQFEQSVHAALYATAENLAAYNKHEVIELQPVTRKSQDYYIVHVNDIIVPNVLEHFLISEFEKHNLNLGFEYGIYDCESQEMVYGKYIGPESSQKTGPHNLLKYPDSPYYFGVRFPEKDSFIVGNMRLMVTFSAILMFVILLIIVSIIALLRQRRLSELQKDFINNMTHEFKTPISTINIAADVFLNDTQIKEDSRLFKYAEIIKGQNTRLLNQVSRVLQIAKIDHPKTELKIEQIKLHDYLEDISRSMEIKLQEKNGQIRQAYTAKNDLIHADPIHLSNIVLNIVDNAIKYASDSAPDILIKTSEQKGYISLDISDNGIGISAPDLKKISNKFYRVERGNVHNVKGYGLGLFYVKRICDLHQWSLNIESKPELGTTVHIVIPNI